jgi:hypothetical protein
MKAKAVAPIIRWTCVISMICFGATVTGDLLAAGMRRVEFPDFIIQGGYQLGATWQVLDRCTGHSGNPS